MAHRPMVLEAKGEGALSRQLRRVQSADDDRRQWEYLDGDGVKLFWLALAATLCLIGIAQAQAPQILLRQYKCYICHADSESKTGPAYADVAARYRGNPRAVAILTAAIRKGVHGSGPWHMPPHPEVSEADAKQMVHYILSLKK